MTAKDKDGNKVQLSIPEETLKMIAQYFKLNVQPEFKFCDDCPPIGYPTDETRCAPCPRRADAIQWGTEPVEFTHAIIDGVHYIKNPSGTWRPDYSVPGTADAISKSVDEAYDAHWSIDRWRK